MSRLFGFIFLLAFLQDYSLPQSELEGTFSLTSQGRLDYTDEYTFSGDGSFIYERLMYQKNECGKGKFTVADSLLTLTFDDVPVEVKDSLRTYYVVNESKPRKGDTCIYRISVVDHNQLPLLGTSAQLVDGNGFNIVDKIKKYWEVDSDANVIVSFPSNINLFGIKIANKGYETLIIPVKKGTNENILVKMLELEKCVHVIEGGTVKRFYLKNVRYAGFYMRGENETEYKYFKKEKE